MKTLVIKEFGNFTVPGATAPSVLCYWQRMPHAEKAYKTNLESVKEKLKLDYKEKAINCVRDTGLCFL